MAKTETYRTPLPDHAVAEIKADPNQREYWENWQAVGDAKLDAAGAFRAVVDAEQAFITCRIESGMRTAPGPVCGCGKHYDQIVKTRAAIASHTPKIEAAVRRFKKGK